METLEEFLAHHGIKGMKWGVRRSRPSGGSAPAHPKSADAARAVEIKRLIEAHGTSSVSNADLKLLNDRAGLETKYHQLFPAKESLAKKGAKMAGDILISVGRAQATAYLNKQVGKALLGTPNTETKKIKLPPPTPKPEFKTKVGFVR